MYEKMKEHPRRVWVYFWSPCCYLLMLLYWAGDTEQMSHGSFPGPNKRSLSQSINSPPEVLVPAAADLFARFFATFAAAPPRGMTKEESSCSTSARSCRGERRTPPSNSEEEEERLANGGRWKLGCVFLFCFLAPTAFGAATTKKQTKIWRKQTIMKNVCVAGLS